MSREDHALHEREWARQHGSNVQHGQARRRSFTKTDAWTLVVVFAVPVLCVGVLIGLML